jgi:hypothetical protein
VNFLYKYAGSIRVHARRSLDGHLAGRMEQYILSVNVQDKAETKSIQSLASLLVTGKMKSLIF